MIYIAAFMLIAVHAWLMVNNHRANARLNALRSNAWLTDERGHRRRYADCSESVRAKAETN